MSERGGDTDSTARIPRSRLYDYVDVSGSDEVKPGPSPAVPSSDEVERRRRAFAVLLGAFRRTAVLVPVDEDDAPLTGDYGGIRWIYAFSNESALARFAVARGEGGREWAYQRWLGARLLDVGMPTVGVPCGVALDVGSEGEGTLFPPVRGIAPDEAAVDVDGAMGDVK
ncbi:hypothetical protein [Streptomyces sp. IMTB 2501]|uniref:hypothetical protein n=1 Tax=Streptomyces sp. IMTB 2501 TaxID=1776340 RepID=UPI002115D663|nr:hypothetical protein [Streptomyces sp. IMTB 2501]